MKIRFERPVSHAARLAWRFATMAFLLCLGALIAHRFGFLSLSAMTALVAVSVAQAVLASLLALAGLQRLWQVGAEGGLAAMRALVLSALPLGLAVATVVLIQRTPPIADVTTDHLNRPEWIHQPVADQLFLLRRPPAEAGAELSAYPALTGRRYDGALDRVYHAVTKVAEAEGITITARVGVDNPVDLEDSAAPPKVSDSAPAEEEEKPAETPAIGPVPQERPEASISPAGRGDVLLQGEKRTLILGLPFDILIRLREDAETTTVDVRVAARFGPPDLGFGAAVAESYLAALDAELLGTSGG